MIADDFLMRTIQAIVAALARVMRLARRGETAQAQLELDAIYSGQLGFTREQLARLDASTVVSMLGVERATAMVSLILAEAEVENAAGHADQAKALQQRALDLDAAVSAGRRRSIV